MRLRDQAVRPRRVGGTGPGAAEIKSLQDALKKSNDLLRELSYTDPLTRLYNRRYLMDSLVKEFQRAGRKKHSLSLALLDIDHFKTINDTHGHQQGDAVLTALAAVIQGELRSYDVVARYGGEEFIALLPDTSAAEGIAVAERLRLAVARMVFPTPLERLRVTVSLGVAAYPAERVATVDDLIREADAALYRAKNGGRNRVVGMAGPAQHVE